MQLNFSFRLFCVTLCMFTVFTGNTQTKQNNKSVQKAEQALVNYLNKLCSDYTVNEMYVELGSVQKPFYIRQQTLCITRRIPDSETTSLIIQYKMPVTEIADVFFDYYIGLQGINEASVTTETSNVADDPFPKPGNQMLLHVAPVGDGIAGYDIQTKLRSLVKTLQEAYRK
jgi:hypothetical protein